MAPTPPLLEAARSAWRNKGKVALFVTTVMTVTALYTFFGPRAYRSEAKLFLRLGRENSMLDATATFGQSPVVAVPQSRENEINSVIEILKSRNLIAKVVDSVGAAAVLGAEPPHESAPADDRQLAPGLEGESPATTPAADREEAIRTVLSQLSVEAARRSDVVVITYEGPTPELCRAVVSRLIDLYLDRHIAFNRTPGEHKFLAEQAERLRGELSRSEDDLRDLQNATGLASPEAQRQLLVTRIGRLEDDWMHAAAELSGAQAEAQALRERRDALAATEVTARTTGMPNAAADAMRAQLYTLQMKELELLAVHPEQHPDVQAVRKQTEAARAILAREDGAREQVTVGPNRVHEEAQVALLKQDPVVAALRARVASLQDQLTKERDRLKTFTEDAVRVARVQREVNLRDAEYVKCAAGLQQARVDEALAEEKITNLQVVEPATYDPKTVRPRLLINFGSGLAFALAGALALALAADRLRQRARATMPNRAAPNGVAPNPREVNPAVSG